ncbi:MAG TPA: type II and III secretion system protein family protein [Blastocatellia bacterium]|nr:type II and III secretion system protein family protein [Blastocatellia bacterium]
MNIRQTPLTFILLIITAVAGYAQAPQPLAVSQQESNPQLSAKSVSNEVILQASEEPVTLRVFAGKSFVLRSPDPLKRVSVTDPTIASAIIVSPNQVLVHGIVPGSVTLLLWDERERTRSFDLRVELDLSGLRETMRQVFPSENIQVSQADSSVVLTGTVSSKEMADRVGALALTRTKNVVNLLVIPQVVGGEVLLQVRFAEVDRTAIQQFGINIFSTGAGNTPGAVSTGQFGPPQAGGQRGEVTSSIPGRLPGFTSSFALTDLLNIFIFRPDLNLGLTIRALQQRNLLQILAEPNLIALNGREANFLAGGEFPFPIVQTGAGLNAVTIVFKEFGVRLKFTPNILPDGTIRLKVAPEVSSLDFGNALTISGFLIPALSTRRAETEVELRDGQSFAIAGLIDNRLTQIVSKVPGLGDIPILGKLFRSNSYTRNNSELLVVVTPKLVKPLAPGQVPPLPTFPKPFLDKDKFDGKIGESPSKPKKN